jgi:NAD(P)-dependent dehydrogenase (short-subunit alcohol dehydrogenase family)
MGVILEGKVSLVTGGGSGIGRGAALLMARQGAIVVVSDVSIEGGEETVHRIGKDGGKGIFIRCDISIAAEVENLVGRIVGEYKRLDCAFNNAGVMGRIPGPLAEQTEEEFERVINVNLKGTFLCMKYEIPQMVKQGGGAIVVNSSTAGLVGSPSGISPYSASKHGLLGLVRSAAIEYAAAGIRVNAVCPGFTRTPALEMGIKAHPDIEKRINAQVPMGRIGSPEEIANAVVWLCSDGSAYVTGQALAVDGGFVTQ